MVRIAGHECLHRGALPTREQGNEAISGNQCRCTGYVKIVLDAILAAANLAAEA